MHDGEEIPATQSMLDRIATGSRPGRGAAAIVLLALFVANLVRVFSLAMEKHPPIWVVDAVPPALSELVFGQRTDYATLAAVDRTYYKTLDLNSPGWVHNSANVAQAIAAVLALDPTTISRETKLPGRTLGTDDKGIIDFVKIAFRLFGYANERIIYLYFIVLFISAGMLILSFDESIFPSLAVGSFLIAHYLILPMVFYNGQLQSVLALRYLPVLGMIPCLHCLYFVASPRLTALRVAALGLQVLLLMFVFNMRSVTAWELATVGGMGGLAFLRSLWARFRGSARPPGGASRAGALFVHLLPAGAILFCFVGLREYRKAFYDERFFKGDQLVTRVFWHNILSGLAFDPRLAATYRLKVDDHSEMRAVGSYLTESGRAGEWAAMWSGLPPFRFSPWPNKIPAYDHAAGELFWAAGREHPVDFIANALYFKPLGLWRDLAWLYGLRSNIPDVEIFVSPELGDAMAVQLKKLQTDLDFHRQRFILWDPVAMVAILLLGIILSAQPGYFPASEWAPLGALALGSLIPTFVGYPAMHTIAEPAIMVAVLLYVALFFLVGKALRTITRPGWKPPSS